jgi:phage tail sheath gpL-like
VVFEIVKGTGATCASDVGRKCIAVSGSETNAVMIDALMTAIDPGSNLNIAATMPSTVITLRNTSSGVVGNQTITEDVADPKFKVSGMSGGTANNCPNGTGCKVDADCATNDCSSSTHKCQ